MQNQLLKKIDYKFLTVLFFVTIFYLYALDKYPLVWVDEPWLAEPSWNLINTGKFINLTFTGFYGKEVLDLMFPAFHLPLAAVFKIFGLNIIAARSLSVMFSILTLTAVYYSLRLLCKNTISALVGVIFLACNPVFFQCARQIRPEAYITFFAVLGFYYLIKTMTEESRFYGFICGVSAGLTLLCHPNGVFVIFTIFFIMLFGSRKNILYYLLGVFIITAPWIGFIFANLGFFREQILSQFAGRALFLKNILPAFMYEPKRWLYPSLTIPASAGFASTIYLIFNNYTRKKYAALISYVLIFAALLCCVDKSKTFLYLNLVFPFFAMTVSAAYSEIYAKKRFFAAGALAIVLLASFVFLPYKVYKSFNSDYYAVTDKFKGTIPRGSVVAGMPTYWFGIEGCYKYRTYDLIYLYAGKYNTRYKNAAKLIKADYVIFDNNWALSYINPETDSFLRNNCVLIKTITDKYYGQSYNGKIKQHNIKIYKVIKDDIR